MAKLTDAEVICAFCEPRPEKVTGANPVACAGEWWNPIADGRGGASDWMPRYLDLDALWKVEERLTDEQWAAYRMNILLDEGGEWTDRDLIHMTPAQKIAALAAVLRPLVEAQHV